jgi:hypothetical protein
MNHPKIADKEIQRMESEVCDKQKITRTINHSATNCLAHQMFKYSAIILEASDIILLMFSNSFLSAS